MISESQVVASDNAALDRVLALAWDALYGDAPAAAASPLRTALCLAPECGEAWAASAEIGFAAATLWRRAVLCDPTERRWGQAWGEALLADDPSQAATVFAALVARRSDAADARLGLARALVRLDRKTEALAHYREAAALTGRDAPTACELAALYIDCGDPLAAAETLAPYAGPHRPDAAALTVSARAWTALGERDRARAALSRAAALGGADAAALLQALSDADAAGADAPPPDAAYVRALFDRYAERFDSELVERLAYRGPQLLGAAAALALPGACGLRVADLGCGTGLAGAVLRPAAAELFGVDLSPAMIAQAAKRGVYDRLSVGGLEAALRAEPAAWDLLAAADVLMYLGDLRETFAAAAAALRPGGVFVFTVEAMTDDERAATGGGGDGAATVPSPFLRTSRRYAHDESYIRAELARAGLTVTALERATLRLDRRRPVIGLVVTAVR